MGHKDRRDKMQLSSRALETLCCYSWPGNIRELENVMQQLIVLTEAQIIEPEDLPIPPSPCSDEPGRTGFKQAKANVIEQFERTYLTELLRARHGNVTHAALVANMERRAFGRLVKKYQIQ